MFADLYRLYVRWSLAPYSYLIHLMIRRAQLLECMSLRDTVFCISSNISKHKIIPAARYGMMIGLYVDCRSIFREHVKNLMKAFDLFKIFKIFRLWLYHPWLGGKCPCPCRVFIYVNYKHCVIITFHVATYTILTGNIIF